MAEHSATRAGAPRPTTPSGLGGQQEGMYSKYCTTPTQPPSPPLSSRVRRRGDDSAVGGGVGCATEGARSGRDRLGVCHTANERSCGETGTAAATSMTAAPRGSCRPARQLPRASFRAGPAGGTRPCRGWSRFGPAGPQHKACGGGPTVPRRRRPAEGLGRPHTPTHLGRKRQALRSRS